MDAFIGEIRAFPYTYCPYGWLPCDGRQMRIVDNQVLYAVIGNLYGGDGSNFNLPDLRGRAVINQGRGDDTINYQMAQQVGTPSVTLTQAQMPSHDHTLQSQGNSSRVTMPSPSALALNPQYLVGTTKYSYLMYVPQSASPAVVPMAPNALQAQGGGQAHDNHSPYLVFRYCICYLDGVFPPRP